MKKDIGRRALLIGGAALAVSACASRSSKAARVAPNRESKMKSTISHCFIAVHDHEKALAFYRDAVGMEVRNDVGYGGMRWVTMGFAGQDVNVVLEPPLADPSASAEDRKVMAELLARGLLRAVNFATDDVEATFARLRDAGAEVVQPPTDQHYGVRDCAFRDPSGNVVRFAQPR